MVKVTLRYHWYIVQLLSFLVTVKYTECLQNNTIVLGGMFPVHTSSEDGQMCGPLRESGIQRLEAMFFAIDQINANKSLLTGINLEARMYDTCRLETYALEQTVEMFSSTNLHGMGSTYVCPNGTYQIVNEDQQAIGIIGASSSSVSQAVGSILRVFKVPQVSYASTSHELSDKTRYEYFLRVVPPDTFQVQAIVDIIKQLGWSYVSTVSSSGNYGKNGIDAFINQTRNEGICVSRYEVIETQTDATYDRIVKYLAEDDKARVVMAFVNEEDVRGLLEAVSRNNLSGHFIWIGSDGWGTKSFMLDGVEMVADESITLVPRRFDVKGFDDYFTSLHPNNNERNIWFDEYWKTLNASTSRDYTQEDKVAFVVDSVYAFAYALQDMADALQLNSELLNEAASNGELLLQFIKNVTFEGKGSSLVSFNEDGDRPGEYQIFQYRYDESTEKGGYVPLGNWQNGQLNLNSSLFRWRNNLKPTSVCSEPCANGEIRKSEGGVSCCWVCTACPTNSFRENETTCVLCDQGFRPGANKTSCIEIEAEYLKWSDPTAIIPVILASIGIVLTCLTIAVFIHFNSTPVIRASGRELSYIILGGILYCYVVPFFILSRPTAVTCGLLRFSLALCTVICYAALLTKTNRIARIFNNSVRSAKRPRYTSPQSQVMICSLLISIQLVAAAIWLAADPPNALKVFPTTETVVLRCEVSNHALLTLISLTYNFLLIVLCTVYAFKTRKIPSNFNEAKFIAFAMYAICLLWIAFITVYLGTSDLNYKIQDVMMSLVVMLSASSLLFCLFCPKIYIVLLQPDKNVRTLGNSGTHSTPQTLKVSTDLRVTASMDSLSVYTQKRTPQLLHAGVGLRVAKSMGSLSALSTSSVNVISCSNIAADESGFCDDETRNGDSTDL